MSTSSEDIVNKAITAADNLSSAGKLNPTQARTFLDYVVDETIWKSHARVVQVDSSFEISKIGVGKRALMPATEGQDPGVRRQATTSKLNFNPRELILCVDISDGFIEENVQGASAEDLVMRIFARKVANDWESMAWHGRTLGPAILQGDLIDGGSSTQYVADPLHSLFDGWLKKAEASHIYDHANGAVGVPMFSKLIKQLPTKFRRQRNQLRMFASSNLCQDWFETLANRGTVLGDSALQGGKARAFGLDLVETPLLDYQPKVVEHIVLTGTTAMPLLYKYPTSVVVTPSTLGSVPTTPFVEDTDYVVSSSAGTIARTSGGAIGSGATVKVTYDAPPSVILTVVNNLIAVFSRDIRIEKQRNIHARTNEYVVSFKAALGVEETDAMALAKNIASA